MTFPPVFSCTLLANSVAETSNSDPGDPTCPSFSSVVWARAVPGKASAARMSGAAKSAFMRWLRQQRFAKRIGRAWNVFSRVQVKVPERTAHADPDAGRLYPRSRAPRLRALLAERRPLPLRHHVLLGEAAVADEIGDPL